MTDKFIYVEDIFEQEQENFCPEFDVCKGNPQTFSLMRLQSKALIKYDETNGPVINDEKYIDLCEDLLRKAKSEHADILLTPEYSFPLVLILKILSDTTDTIKPSIGKIWCLCCQGTQYDVFQDFLGKCEESGAKVIKDAVSNTSAKNFVDALIYVFLLKNSQVCILPQLKTHIMADRELQCEGDGMCIGNIIYKFGKGYNNQLCTIICADSLNSRYVNLNNVNGINENVILLHPQLNEKPRNSTFTNLRYTLYSNADCDRLVYITANWAFGTILMRNITPSDENKLQIISPWSCIYLKDTSNNWLEKQRSLRKENYSKGLDFGYFSKCKLKVFFSNKNENVQLITIKKPSRVGASVVQPEIDVKVNKLFSRDDKSWVETESIYDDDDLKTLLGNPESDYEFPIYANKELREKYFGFCLGTLEEGQLLINDNEICCNVSIHIDGDCDSIRNKMLNNYHRLINYLKLRKLPPYLKDLVNNHILCLEDNIFNVKSKELDMNSKALVAYVPDETEAKKVCNKFKEIIDNYKKSNIDIISNLLNEDKFDEAKKLAQQEYICVFTEERDTGKLITYPEFKPEITAGDRMSDGISITR